MSTVTQFEEQHPSIPEELRQREQWLAWCYEDKQDKRTGEVKRTKVPYSASTSAYGSSTDPSTWTSFEAVNQALVEGRLGAGGEPFAGMGFVFTEADPYVGIDIDHCRDPQTGQLTPKAQELADRFSPYAYTEISPSGTGVHLIVRGVWSNRWNRQAWDASAPDSLLEVYDRRRFFTVTGECLGAIAWCEIASCQEELDKLAAEYVRTTTRPQGQEDAPVQLVTVTDVTRELDEEERQTVEDIVTWAQGRSRNSDTSRLWFDKGWEKATKHDGTRRYDSQSSADFALLVRIRKQFPLASPTELAHAWSQSKLWRRDDGIKRSTPEEYDAYAARTIQKVLEATADISRQAESLSRLNNIGKPLIPVKNRSFDEVVMQAIEELVVANEHGDILNETLYVRSGQLVRVVRDEKQRPHISEIRESTLAVLLARAATFYAAGGDTIKIVEPPRSVVSAVLQAQNWSLPALEGITEIPVLRADGSILDTPGYDPETHLLYSPLVGQEVGAIPERPSEEEVRAAVALLEDVVTDFPFVDQASRANAFALMMTPLLRPLISGNVPLALIDATSKGTGKTLLAKTVALPYVGRDVGLMTVPDSDAEWRKKITTELYQGSAFIILDNVSAVLRSQELAAVLTTREWRDRLLGTNMAVALPNNAVWIATGNNIQLSGDIPRRVYRIRLDAQQEQPWTRQNFKHAPLDAWILEHRTEILRALLVLCRHWYAEGRPKASVTPFGSFESWSQIVGGVLQAAHIDGFLVDLSYLWQEADEESIDWGFFVETWYRTLGRRPVTVRELTDELRRPLNDAFRSTLPGDLAEHMESPSFTKRLGRALKGARDRLFGAEGLRVTQVRGHQMSQWYVAPLKEAQQTTGDVADGSPEADDGDRF